MNTDGQEGTLYSYLRLSALICGLFTFPVYAQDVREIVRRALDLNLQTEDLSRNYAFFEREHVRILDGKGGLKRETWKTEGVTLLEGSPYRRLVARDGRPLTPAEQKQEDEKLHWNDQQRRNETPEQRERRLAEWRHRHEQRAGPFREALEAFDFKLAGEETLDGVPVYVITATPKPGYKPKSSVASMLPKVKARLWIAKGDYGLVRVDAEALETVSYGAILFRLVKGSRVEIRQERVSGELWLRKRIAVELSGRVMLLSPLREEIDFTYRDYKKFQADSRMVPSTVPPLPGK